MFINFIDKIQLLGHKQISKSVKKKENLAEIYEEIEQYHESYKL